MKIKQSFQSLLRKKVSGPVSQSAVPFIKLGSAIRLTGDSEAGDTPDGSSLVDYNKKYSSSST